MNKNFILYFLCLLYSCQQQEAPQECRTPLGKLMLSTVNIDWGNVQLGKSYTQSIKIYNATSKKAILKIYNTNPEFKVIKIGKKQINPEKETFLIPAFHSDSIKVIFSPNDTSSIGELKKDIYIETDGKLLVAPLEQHATILENFENLSNNKKYPIINIDKDTFNFGTITWKDRPTATFLLKNEGEQNLIIRKVEKKCGCTNAYTVDRVIFPGKSTILNVTFNPMGKNGKQSTQIRIFCNDPKHPVIEFTITGCVVE